MASKPASKASPKPPKGATTPPKAPPAPSSASSARSAPTRPTASQVDVGAVARAVSAGFMILVFGGLIQPIVSTYVPLLGMFWLILVAVTAFAVAGARVGIACPNPPLHGAGAAILSYLLVVPLMFLQGTFNPLYTVYSFVAAAIVGAAAGVIGARSKATRS